MQAGVKVNTTRFGKDEKKYTILTKIAKNALSFSKKCQKSRTFFRQKNQERFLQFQKYFGGISLETLVTPSSLVKKYLIPALISTCARILEGGFQFFFKTEGLKTVGHRPPTRDFLVTPLVQLAKYIPIHLSSD